MGPLKTYVLGLFILLIHALEVCQCNRFIIGFMKNKEATKALAIYIFNPNQISSTAYINTHKDMGLSFNAMAPPMSSTKFNVPQNFEVTETTKSRKGISIISDDEIVVLGINRVNQGSYTYMESFLAIPEESLGLSYYAVTMKDRAEILIVAGYPNTSVIVDVKGLILHNGIAFYTGSSFTSTLDQFDTLLLQSDPQSSSGLTGTHITSNKVVSVYSGNEYMSIGKSNHLVQQLAPVRVWGYLYITVPLSNTVYDLIIVAAYSSTKVWVTCETESTIQERLATAGSFAVSSKTFPCVIESAKAVSVTMLVSSGSFDPVMIRIQPLQIQSKEIEFFVKPDDFVSELVLVTEPGIDISIDNTTVNLKLIQETDYYFLRTGITHGTHIIKCSQPCHLSAYIHGRNGMEAMGYPIHVKLDDEKSMLTTTIADLTTETLTRSSTTLTTETTTKNAPPSSESSIKTEPGSTMTTTTDGTTVTSALEHSVTTTGTETLEGSTTTTGTETLEGSTTTTETETLEGSTTTTETDTLENSTTGTETLENSTTGTETLEDSTTTTETDTLENSTTGTETLEDSTTTIEIDALENSTTASGAGGLANSSSSSSPATVSSMGERSTDSSMTTGTTQAGLVNTSANDLSQTCTCHSYSCQSANFSHEELVNLVAELRQKLLVQKRSTTNYIRKLTSAPDHRTSSKVVGYIAGSVLVALMVGLLIIDIPNLWRMINTIKENISCR